jgi:ABC-2 type transport system ATP-binding protein
VEVLPADPADRDRAAAVLARFGAAHDQPLSPRDGVAVRLRGGDAALADVVRALDAEDIPVGHLQLHAPTLDDVFLAKTGRSLEGSGDGEDAEGAGEPALEPATA